MSTVASRWIPAVVVPAVIAVGAFAVPWQAGAAVDLPEKTPNEVLALAAASTVESLSGSIEQSSHLGLPELPTLEGSSGQDLNGALELLTGSHSARVYLDGPEKARLQVTDQLGERDVVRNGADAWFYDFDKKSALHLTMPKGAGDRDDDQSGMMGTPQQLADQFLGAVEPSTTVSLGRNTTVAGRTAYTLVLAPKASGTLVGSVSIAVDAKTGLPLRVDVNARGQKQAAFEVAFTALTLSRPDADVFTFAPPEGTDVETVPVPAQTGHMPALPDASGLPAGVLPTVSGSGWDAIVELPAASVPTEALDDPMVQELTQKVTGGRVFTSALLSVLVTDDGRVLAGSVPAERLQAAAARR